MRFILGQYAELRFLRSHTPPLVLFLRSHTPQSLCSFSLGVILHLPYNPLGSMCGPSGRQACHLPSRGEVRVTSTRTAHPFPLQFLCNQTFCNFHWSHTPLPSGSNLLCCNFFATQPFLESSLHPFRSQFLCVQTFLGVIAPPNLQ